MAKTDFHTVEDYLATRSDEERTVLLQMQAAILSALPEAEPTISYQLPAYRADGWIFYISAFTNHYTLSCPPPFFEGFKDELARLCGLQIGGPVSEKSSGSVRVDLGDGKGPGAGKLQAGARKDGLTIPKR